MNANLPPTVKSFEEMLAMFDYDRTAPLAVEEASVADRHGIAVHDLGYASQRMGRTAAYLITPAGHGPFAGVVFVHPAPGARPTFMEEAITLAQRGVVCLLPDAPWAQGEAWGRTLGQPEGDRQAFLQIAIVFRRAIDLLAAQPNVDMSRIGYVGHSFGALFGGVLSGVEKRIQAFVLMAGTGSFTDVAVLSMPFLQGQALEQYAQAMSLIDPTYYVGRAAPAALLYQSGLQDEAFPRDKVEGFIAAGSQPKSVKWYDAGHFLDDEARAYRLEWLGARLGLSPRQ